MNNTKRMIRPEALLITMSKLNVIEWGGIEKLDKFFSIHYSGANDKTWWYKIGSNFPKHQSLLYVYLVIHNEIRWRFNFVGFEECPNGIRLMKNGVPTDFYGKFICITGPALKSAETIPFKGFQGFRYSEIIY